jgi:hypothetical protein
MKITTKHCPAILQISDLHGYMEPDLRLVRIGDGERFHTHGGPAHRNMCAARQRIVRQ